MTEISRRSGLVGMALIVAGCAHEIAFNPSYVPPERPTYIADGALLVVLKEADRELVYERRPGSAVGASTTLTVPLNAIMREIATDVFGSCFGRGVTFASERTIGGDYVLALEGDLENFFYSYERYADQGFEDENPDLWTIPEVEVAFDLRVFDNQGSEVLDKTYDSGMVAGERYLVDSHHEERINQVLHDTLHALLLQVADDIYPLLVGECTVYDIDS